jgi:DNA-binding MarR family transcriptional regulator
MDLFEEIAEKVSTYRLRKTWLGVAKFYNEMSQEYDGTLAMGFVLLTIGEEHGVPVTKIAPRMGMEPNSLSRILKTMEERGAVYRRPSKLDKRKVYICLTLYGQELRELAIKTVFELEAEVREKVSEEEMQTFFKVLSSVSESVESLSARKSTVNLDIDTPAPQP